MADDLVLGLDGLGFPWKTVDPFLFCVHHDDAYPKGNAQLGPEASLAGRNLGNDFTVRDGFRMYHGDVVPGFPRHPHRGFETVTIARQGFIDHSDSLGAAARFGEGDVQWVTAGRGICHSEMFPLLNQEADNPVELFQIWLNLPRDRKMAEPHFTMFWNPSIPRVRSSDSQGRETEVTIITGTMDGVETPKPPPESWAAVADSDVAIWTIRMAPGAQWELPAARPGSNRMLYFFRGNGLRIGSSDLPESTGAIMPVDSATLINGDAEGELLLLQGRPIGEPVAQHGPFVMNTREEILEAYNDYQRTEFGGWPWKDDAPVHDPQKGRHARFPDGRLEEGP